MFYAISDLLNEVLKIGLGLSGNLEFVELDFMGIAQNGRRDVVGGNDDKALGNVENVEGWNPVFSVIGGGKTETFVKLQHCAVF